MVVVLVVMISMRLWDTVGCLKNHCSARSLNHDRFALAQIFNCHQPTKDVTGQQLQPAKVLMKAETCAERKSTFPRLFVIPAFDRIAGHCNRLPNSNGEYASANFSKVRLKALTNKTQTLARS